MTIGYRRAGTEDAEAIDHVFRTSFCDTFAHLYRPEDLEAFLSKFTLDAWTAELGDERYDFHVAEADGEIIGFVKLGPPELPVRTSGPAIERRQLDILHEWRRPTPATHAGSRAGEARRQGRSSAPATPRARASRSR